MRRNVKKWGEVGRKMDRKIEKERVRSLIYYKSTRVCSFKSKPAEKTASSGLFFISVVT